MSENISSISSRIGAQIRMYRKTAQISLDELAQMINKSRATVSKYESGAISIDVSTLFEIGFALNVDVSHLVDIEKTKKSSLKVKNPLAFSESFYLYHTLFNKNYCSFIKLGHEEKNGQISATLFYKSESMDDYKSCECIYNGYMNAYDNIINFVLQNLRAEAELVHLSFFIPMKRISIIPGMMVGIDSNSMRPIAYKVVLSTKKLMGAALQEALLVSKGQIKRLKDDHCFMIDG